MKIILAALYILVIFILFRDISNYLKIIEVIDDRKLISNYKLLILLNILILFGFAISMYSMFDKSLDSKLFFYIKQLTLIIMILKLLLQIRINKKTKNKYL